MCFHCCRRCGKRETTVRFASSYHRDPIQFAIGEFPRAARSRIRNRTTRLPLLVPRHPCSNALQTERRRRIRGQSPNRNRSGARRSCRSVSRVKDAIPKHHDAPSDLPRVSNPPQNNQKKLRLLQNQKTANLLRSTVVPRSAFQSSEMKSSSVLMTRKPWTSSKTCTMRSQHRCRCELAGRSSTCERRMPLIPLRCWNACFLKAR